MSGAGKIAFFENSSTESSVCSCNGARAPWLRAVLFACVVGGVAACDSDTPPPGRVTFIGGGGSVTTLDIAADSVIDVWNITQSPSLGAVDEPRWDGMPLEDQAYDARRGIVFLVLPDRAREEIDRPKHYRMVAASLPRLERIATFAFPDSALPTLLFDPIGDRLMAQTSRLPLRWPHFIMQSGVPCCPD